MAPGGVLSRGDIDWGNIFLGILILILGINIILILISGGYWRGDTIQGILAGGY